MKFPLFIAALSLSLSLSAGNLWAAEGSSVPGQIRLSGQMNASGTAGVTFALYAKQTDGAALWLETQNVSADSEGNYLVLLGSETAGGIPQSIFSSGEARWLEVSYTAADGARVTQPRVLLVSVPYALKAGDAETLGGLPASAFLLNPAALAARVGALPGAAVNDVLPSAAVTAGRIAKFTDGAGATGDSILTESNNRIGVNVTSPNETMEVDGGLRLSNFGQLKFHATGDPGARFQMGVSGAGGMQFQSLDGVTPRRFFLVSSTGLAFFQEELENGNITTFGKIGAGVVPLNTMDTAGNMAIGTFAGANAAPLGGLIVSGNVGVGTSSPTEKLHVVGNILTSGIVTTAGTLTGAFALTGNGAGAGKVLTSDANGVASWQTPAGGGGAATDVNCPAGCVDSADITDNAISNADINPNAAIVPSKIAGTAAVLGANTFTGAQTINNSATVSGDLTVDTTTLKVDSASNRVGVNTAAPTQALDVNGNIRVRTGGNLIMDSGSTLDLSAGGSFTGDVTVNGSVSINEVGADPAKGPAASAMRADGPTTASITGGKLIFNGQTMVGTGGVFGFTQNANSPNTVIGYGSNIIDANVVGGAIGGGGAVGSFGDPPNTQSTTANRITDSFGVVAGGSGNRAGNAAGTVNDRNWATVGGGNNNIASGNWATVSGGRGNTASNLDSTVGGGSNNNASGSTASIHGGTNNTASGSFTTVGGGSNNASSGFAATIAGGYFNTASADYTSVGGGTFNTASNHFAMVPGGAFNQASGQYSFAAGRRAKALHTGSFVWGDSSNADIVSALDNEFTARAVGGFNFLTNTAHSTGCWIVAAGGSWTCSSDRNEKENFQPVDGEALLQRLDQIPITTWNFKTQDPKYRHLGPMAQDFFGAFGLGEGDHGISSVDAQGVALAGVQALYRMVNEKLKEKDAEITELREMLHQLQVSQATADGQLVLARADAARK